MATGVSAFRQASALPGFQDNRAVTHSGAQLLKRYEVCGQADALSAGSGRHHMLRISNRLGADMPTQAGFTPHIWNPFRTHNEIQKDI